jgi:hypothetical protein
MAFQARSPDFHWRVKKGTRPKPWFQPPLGQVSRINPDTLSTLLVTYRRNETDIE